MDNNDKVKELCDLMGFSDDKPCLDGVYREEVDAALIDMANWKDLENKWHKISDGDFPKFTGDYLLVCKNKNKEGGIFLYEIAYYTGDEWDNRTNYEDVIAWREVPEYNER